MTRMAASTLLLVVVSFAQEPVLPPAPAWKGESVKLAVAPDHDWATPFERSGMKETPRYAETVAWLRRLVAAAPELSMLSLGRSGEGREIWMVVATKEGAATAEALRSNGRPTLLAQGAIHAGEVDGKDAGMMLLRDLTVTGRRKDLLDGANFCFVPILSVDGHERFGKHFRVNQRGPLEAGWRTNSRNRNLNRDYAKLDTPGVRAAVRAIREWQPDLYYDIHVTDGADYQYDITWGYNGPHAHSPAIARWLAAELDPALRRALSAQGHTPGPLVFAADGADMTKGNHAPTFGPRFSNGYGDLRHLPTFLVENHSLKRFHRRVLGTYVLLAATLERLGRSGMGLRAAIEADRKRRPERVPLSFKRPDGEPRTVPFLGIGQRVVDWPVTGGRRVLWTGERVTLTIPLLEQTEPEVTVERPTAYWIPPAFVEIIDRLAAHGIEFERLAAPRQVNGFADRVTTFELARKPFEGRVRVSAQFTQEPCELEFPAGSVRVSTDQPLGDLAVALLDPRGPDSFFQWGFLLGFLQRTEYIEGYVVDPLAEKMLAADKKLRAEYEARLEKDEAFRKDPAARRRWFYERTPWYDSSHLRYPIVRTSAR